jgi:single-strand DNA-binding protein
MNKVMIIGFVEQAPTVRYTAHGQAVSAFGVSTRRGATTQSGETGDTSGWFSIVAWGEMAIFAHRNLSTGQRVFVEGCLQTRGWEDERSQRHSRTEVVAGKLIPLDDREWLAEREGTTPARSGMHCLNQAMVIGNLGRDPEMRYTPDGQAITSFSMAASHSWVTAEGDRRESTEWFNVVSWGSLAEICNQYLTKGRRIYVEGELRTRSWTQTDGQRRFRTELIASEMIMLGPRQKQRFEESEANELVGEPPF